MTTMDLIQFYLMAILAIASLIDIKSLRIPNWLTYSTLAVGISYFSFVRGYEGFLFSLTGAAAGCVLLIFPFVIGATGAGDVKLLAAVGGFLGPMGAFKVFILSGILGFVYALLLLGSQGLLVGTFKRYGRILKAFIITGKILYLPASLREKQIKIKFGLAIALGTCLYIVSNI